MSTISKAKQSIFTDQICQGDIFQNVKYNYIETEDDQNVNVTEYEFPFAIIISQACDVIAMSEMQSQRFGKTTKFMPSILLCPIYDETMVKSGEHITDALAELEITVDQDNVYQKEDLKVAKRDWHYRFHPLTIEVGDNIVMGDSIIDFKHYFSVPISYLITNRNNRILHLDDLFAEQITLKFATYLSRVAIP